MKKAGQAEGKNGGSAARLCVVGLGASAGGLEALEEYLQAVPAGSGLAHVVIQHQDPTQPGMMTEILQRATSMPVTLVKGGEQVQADHVYVMPSNQELSLRDGHLRLSAPTAQRGLRLPIDLFFRSLAEDGRERAAAVILSGLGTDGTLGIQAVKEAGGLVLVQAPSSAKFDGMPRSALATGLADLVEAPSELGARLPGLFRTAADAAPPEDRVGSAMTQSIALLRAHTHHDFSLYKKSTIYRRIERRMGVHQVTEIGAYVRFLRENLQEREMLAQELLIGVTSFFRDPAAWEYLRKQVFPEIFASRPEGGVLRAWTPACSTGEDPYSLGMVFREALEAAQPAGRWSLQIFATDASAQAVERARQGLYPPNIEADVSAERLRRFFRPEEAAGAVSQPGHYRIAKEIRDMVTLATQNVLQDPPFTKLDLLVCRNLLIYLELEAQRKLLPLFHFSLKPGGTLLLGNAESIGNFTSLFEPLEARLRLYRRLQNGARTPACEFPSTFPVQPRRDEASAAVAPPSLKKLTEELILKNYTPAAVVVSAAGDLVYIHGRTGKYLEPAAGKADLNVLSMAREGLRLEMQRLLRKAGVSAEVAVSKGLRVKTNGHYERVDVSVQALEHVEGLRGMFLVVFEEAAEPESAPKRSGGKVAKEHATLREMEREMVKLCEELRTSREEMQTSQEELKSTNEELQSANEELQSANEELTTSKEELQSLNEELQTVNAELQSKLEELMHANNDMRNLLNSTEIATVFLDGELRLRRFTNNATQIIKLIPGDVGRPVTDIVTELDYPELARDVDDVLRSLRAVEKQVSTRDGRWFTARVMPYRTVDNVIDGVVVTFTDITGHKKLEAELRRLTGGE